MMLTKFRAWHKKENRMVKQEEISSLHYLDGELNIVQTRDSRLLGIGDLRLMPWVGLKDFHNQELYHSDIVQDEEENDGVLRIIVWDQEYCMFCANLVKGDKHDPYYSVRLDDIHMRKKGNIFENSELLGSRV